MFVLKLEKYKCNGSNSTLKVNFNIQNWMHNITYYFVNYKSYLITNRVLKF